MKEKKREDRWKRRDEKRREEKRREEKRHVKMKEKVEDTRREDWERRRERTREEARQDKIKREKMKDNITRKWREEKRTRRQFFFFKKKCFETFKPARWICPKFRKRMPVGRFIPPFLSKVQNLIVFSIIYMIWIRFLTTWDDWVCWTRAENKEHQSLICPSSKEDVKKSLTQIKKAAAKKVIEVHDSPNNAKDQVERENAATAADWNHIFGSCSTRNRKKKHAA